MPNVPNQRYKGELVFFEKYSVENGRVPQTVKLIDPFDIS